MIYELDDLKQYISGDIAVFLGSGSSINTITKKQWVKLLSFDTWAVNNWVYHPTIVPKFYHLEVKPYDKDILKRRFEEKWEKYRDTKFITYQYRKELINEVVGHENESNIYTYNREKVKNGEKIRKHKLTRSYNASITVVLDMLYKFGYNKIILCGVDLLDSKYFWTDGDPKVYGEVHCNWNKDTIGHKINDPHSTHNVSDFIINFNEYMKIHNKEVFIINNKTKLYPHIRLFEV